MAEEKKFLSAADVAEIMECLSLIHIKSKSYGIIRQLNAELLENGFVVMAGKVNAKYFYKRIYDGEGAAHE